VIHPSTARVVGGVCGGAAFLTRDDSAAAGQRRRAAMLQCIVQRLIFCCFAASIFVCSADLHSAVWNQGAPPRPYTSRGIGSNAQRHRLQRMGRALTVTYARHYVPYGLLCASLLQDTIQSTIDALFQLACDVVPPQFALGNCIAHIIMVRRYQMNCP